MVPEFEETRPAGAVAELLDAYRLGRLSRRQLVQGLAALGLSLTAMASLIRGNGQKTSAAQATPGPVERPARSGGKLVASMSQSPSTLDPAFGINAPEFAITSLDL